MSAFDPLWSLSQLPRLASRHAALCPSLWIVHYSGRRDLTGDAAIIRGGEQLQRFFGRAALAQHPKPIDAVVGVN